MIVGNNKPVPTAPKISIINETPIQKASTNGGREKEIIYENIKKEKFKIHIISETYTSQSYAKLFKWSDTNGWLSIIWKNPKNDFNINISSSDTFNQNAFLPILIDLMKISENF